MAILGSIMLAPVVAFGAHHINLNEGRPKLSLQKYIVRDSNFWWYEVCIDIRRRSHGSLRQSTVMWSKKTIFVLLMIDHYMLETFGDNAQYYYILFHKP